MGAKLDSKHACRLMESPKGLRGGKYFWGSRRWCFYGHAGLPSPSPIALAASRCSVLPVTRVKTNPGAFAFWVAPLVAGTDTASGAAAFLGIGLESTLSIHLGSRQAFCSYP